MVNLFICCCLMPGLMLYSLTGVRDDCLMLGITARAQTSAEDHTQICSMESRSLHSRPGRCSYSAFAGRLNVGVSQRWPWSPMLFLDQRVAHVSLPYRMMHSAWRNTFEHVDLLQGWGNKWCWKMLALWPQVPSRQSFCCIRKIKLQLDKQINYIVEFSIVLS